MWVSRSSGSIAPDRPLPKTGWMVTPPTYGVPSARLMTRPISSSFTPRAAVMVSVVKMPLAESRSMARSLKRRMSAPRWYVDASADSPSYCR